FTRSTWITSPERTLACLPPARMMAYMNRPRRRRVTNDQISSGAPSPTKGFRGGGLARLPVAVSLGVDGGADDRDAVLDRLLVQEDAPSLAVGAGLGEVLQQAGGDVLAGHLDQAQLGDVEDLGAGLVLGERLLELAENQLLVLLLFHVDEV